MPDYRIHFHGARDIPKTDFFGHCDPYLLVYYPADAPKHIFKTKTVKNTATPVWNESVSIRHDGCHDHVRIVLMDEDMISDDYVSEITFSLLECAVKMDVDLMDPKNLGKGRLGVLTMTADESITVVCNPQMKAALMPRNPDAPSSNSWKQVQPAYVNDLANVFLKYEVPQGLLQRLNVLSTFAALEFIIDDSGSMGLPTDSVDPRTKQTMSRWQEVEQRVCIMIEFIAYLATKPIVNIVFLNRTTSMQFAGGSDVHPSRYLEVALAQIRGEFKRGPAGGTPVISVLKRSFARYGSSQKVARYFFGDGSPDGGATECAEVVQFLMHRADPSITPFTFNSCTDDDHHTKWMKECEEMCSYVAEYDDYNDEKGEVEADQGRAFPFTYGMYLMCTLVGAMYPDDLDALDESVPLPKAALDSIEGYVLAPKAYEKYFSTFMEAQAAHQVISQMDRLKRDHLAVWAREKEEFLTARSMSQILCVRTFRTKLASLRQQEQAMKYR